MARRLRWTRFGPLALVLGVVSNHGARAAAAPPLPGDNVNMVSGRQWPGGDPFGQRQNEPSIAVSSVNPNHLLAGANDYRTVNIAKSLATTDEHGDAWLSYLRSLDGGATWQSYLLPGFPEQQADPTGSPLFGYQAASDPVVRAGQNGLFYYSGIVFDRNSARSAVFVARFVDRNNQESGNAAAGPGGSDPIQYLDTSIVDLGTNPAPGASPPLFVFQDKPWIAVDVPRADQETCTVNNTQVPCTCTIDGKNVPAGKVYVAYSTFLGRSATDLPWSQIKVRRSKDCGRTWQAPVVLSGVDDVDPNEPDGDETVDNGASIAIDPRNGDVWVTYRRFANNMAGDTVLVRRSQDGGRTFGPEYTLRQLSGRCTTTDPRSCPSTTVYDQEISSTRFRNEMFPSIAVSTDGSQSWVHVAWSEREPLHGDGRIYLATRTACPVGAACQEGALWSQPRPADPGPFSEDGSGYTFNRGHQFMPALTSSQGRLMLLYYHSYLDHARRYWQLNPAFFVDHTPGAPMFIEWVGPIGTDALAAIFGPDVDDAAPPLVDLRHTIDVRVAQFPVGAFAGCSSTAPQYCTPANSTRVTRFPFGYQDGGSATQAPLFSGALLPIANGATAAGAYAQTQFNPPNYPMFANGTLPFMGDYLDIRGQDIVPTFDATGNVTWQHNIGAAPTPTFHAVWADNRDVRVPPPNATWLQYTPPVQSITLNPDGSFTATPNASCDPLLSGMRDQNVYTSRITEGVLLSSVQNVKPLDPGVQRAFAVEVRNTTELAYTVKLVLPQVSGLTLSFLGAGGGDAAVALNVPAHFVVYQSVFATNVGNVSPSTVIPLAWGSAQGANQPIAGIATPNTLALNGAPANGLVTSGGTVVGQEQYLALVTSQNVTSQNVTSQNVTSNGTIQNVTSAPLAVQNVTSSGVPVQNVTSQNVTSLALNQNVTSQNVTSQNVTSQNVTSAAVVDVDYTVQSAANTATVYNVVLYGPTASATNAQLILYSTYFTQTQITDTTGACVTADVPHTYVSTVVNNPTINDINAAIADGTFGDPNSPAANATNARFVLLPGETKQITIRNLVSDVNAPLPAAPVVVAQASTPINPVVTAPPTITSTLSTLTPPPPTVNTAWTPQLQAIGGSGQYTWSLVPAGTNPVGLQVSPNGTISWTPTAAGPFSFTVQLQDANNACATGCPTRTFSSVVSREPTTTTLSTSLSGSTATLIATVAATVAGTTQPTGTVMFYDNSVAINGGTVNLVSGVAQIALAQLAPGVHVITVGYPGDANFVGSNSNVARLVTTTTSVGSGSSHTYGDTGMTFTITIAGADTTAASGGSVTLYDACVTSNVGVVTAGNVVASAAVVGAASTSVTVGSALAAGSHNLCAVYTPAANGVYLGSVSALTTWAVNVPAADVTVTLKSSAPGPVSYKQPYTLTATLTTIAAGEAPSGSIIFSDQEGGSAAVVASKTVPLSGGTATYDPTNPANALDALAIVLLQVGTHTITATYCDAACGGDGIYADGQYATIVQVVNPAVTSTTLAAFAPNPATYGMNVLLGVLVAPSPLSAGIPDGTVAWYDLGTTCPAALPTAPPAGATRIAVTQIAALGSSSLSYSSFTVGKHCIAAYYTSSSGRFAPSGRIVGLLTVNPYKFTGYGALKGAAPLASATYSGSTVTRPAQIVLSWQLSNVLGVQITSVSTLQSVRAYANTSAACGGPPAAGAATTTIYSPASGWAAGSSVTYNTTAKQFQMSWGTSVIASAGCYTLALGFADGSTWAANFPVN